MQLYRRPRRAGMTSLQAVLLLGAGFLVVWGLMELFDGSKGTANANTALTLRGEFKRPVAQAPVAPPGDRNEPVPPVENGPEGRGPDPDDETELVPEGEDLSERSLNSLLWGLYAMTLTPEEREELDGRLNSNILMSSLFFIPSAELEYQRVRGIRDPYEKATATFFGAAMYGLDLLPAKPKGVGSSVVRSSVVQGANAARRLKLPGAVAAFRKEFGQLGGRYADLKKMVERLEEKYPKLKGELQVHHVPPHSATEIPFEDGAAMIMDTKHHGWLPTSRNDQAEIDAIREAWEKSRVEGVRGAREEIDNMLEQLGKESGATAQGPLRDAYDQGYMEALVYLFRGGKSK